MRSYTPDKWSIIDYSPEYPHTDRYAVLAGWGGSFTTGASWKRSSPILSVEEAEEAWNVRTHSGALYILRKDGHGVTGQTASLAAEAQLTMLTEDETIALFKTLNEGELK